MTGCLSALCSDIFMLLTCIDFFSITASLGSLISLGGTGVMTGYILDAVFDFFWDMTCSPLIGLIIDFGGELLELILAIAYIGPIISAGTAALTAILHELPGFIYACCFGNCYGIAEIICGIGNLLCLVPAGCLTISSFPFCLSPLFYPFGFIATLLSAIISFFSIVITPIMGCIGGCFRTMFCAVGGDIFSDLIGDYIPDICCTPILKLIGGSIATLVTIYATGYAGYILGIIIDMIISFVMGIIEIPLDLIGEFIDMIGETFGIGLSTLEILFGQFICCLPAVTLPCYIGQCIVNKIICIIPFCWI